MRFEGVAGEFSQHDFGHVRVTYDTGRTETLHFFASRLKFSRWSHVMLVPNEKIEALVRALLAGLEAFGGVPLVCVFDNPKTIVVRHDGPKIEWNPTFAQVAADMRFGPERCTPGRGQEKGSVENLVKWVKGSFFKVRRFHDREDLERQLAEGHREVNVDRPSRATGVPPAARMEEERQRLRPLPYSAADYPLRFPVSVTVTAMVEYEGIRYSMPPKSIGMPGTLFLYPRRVRIVERHYDVEHPRLPDVGRTSYRPEHRAQLLAEVSGERGKLYLKRRPMIFTTNKPVEAWGKVLHDPDLAEAILDRVLERGRVIQLRGPSYRTRHLKGDRTTAERDTLLGRPGPGERGTSPPSSDMGAGISGKTAPEFLELAGQGGPPSGD